MRVASGFTFTRARYLIAHLLYNAGRALYSKAMGLKCRSLPKINALMPRITQTPEEKISREPYVFMAGATTNCKWWNLEQNKVLRNSGVQAASVKGMNRRYFRTQELRHHRFHAGYLKRLL